MCIVPSCRVGCKLLVKKRDTLRLFCADFQESIHIFPFSSQNITSNTSRFLPGTACGCWVQRSSCEDQSPWLRKDPSMPGAAEDDGEVVTCCSWYRILLFNKDFLALQQKIRFVLEHFLRFFGCSRTQNCRQKSNLEIVSSQTWRWIWKFILTIVGCLPTTQTFEKTILVFAKLMLPSHFKGLWYATEKGIFLNTTFHVDKSHMQFVKHTIVAHGIKAFKSRRCFKIKAFVWVQTLLISGFLFPLTPGALHDSAGIASPTPTFFPTGLFTRAIGY